MEKRRHFKLILGYGWALWSTVVDSRACHLEVKFKSTQVLLSVFDVFTTIEPHHVNLARMIGQLVSFNFKWNHDLLRFIRTFLSTLE